jgi:hypothetical protein
MRNRFSAGGGRQDSPKTLRVYHIGNSVTDTINYGALKEMAKAKGRTYVFGRHMIPGAPLQWIYEHPKDGFQEEPYGYYPNALPHFAWDALTLQPFDRHIDGKDGDLEMAKRYIDLAVKKSPNLRVYLYSRWPRREKDGSLDYGKAWARRYTGGWDGTNETREYFEMLTHALRKAYPAMKERIFLVPVGDTLLELERRIQAKEVPGLSSVLPLYADGIHFTNVGSFLVGSVFYATLFRDDPTGLPGAPYKVNDPMLVRALQETAWRVVSRHPMAGVVSSRDTAR